MRSLLLPATLLLTALLAVAAQAEAPGAWVCTGQWNASCKYVSFSVPQPPPIVQLPPPPADACYPSSQVAVGCTDWDGDHQLG